MSVQDYELLLRVRADMLQAISGLDSVRKKLDDAGNQAKDMGDKAGKAVDGMSKKFDGLKSLIAGLAIGAGIKAVFGAVQESENAVAQLDARLKSTGGSAGLTRDQLIDLSAEMQKLTTYGDEAVLSMETLLLTFGNIKGPVFKQATQAVLDMSVALGQDLQSTATQVGKALNDPILGITALRKVGVNFTDSQKSVIQALVDTGQTAAAQRVILQELETEYGGAAKAAANTFGGALSQLKEAAGDLLEGDGGNLPEMTGSVKELTETLRDPGVKEGFAIMVGGLVTVAGAAAKAIAAVAGFSKYIGEAIARSTGAAVLGDTVGIEDRNAAIKEELAAREGLFKGYFHRVHTLATAISPGGALKQVLGENEVQNVDLARKSTAELNAELERNNTLLKIGAELQRPAKPVTKPTAPASAIDTLPTVTVNGTQQEAADKAAADKAAAQTAKFVAAGAALQKQMTDLQGTLGPAAAAWNAYNAEVDKANAAADLAKKAPNANAEAIDGERQAVIGLAATIRDAALDKLAAADREAWERLRDSLRTPAEVQLDKALSQIKELNDDLAKGVINSAQYNDALQRVGTQSVVALPKYQGADAAVTGPYGEMAKNFKAQDDLDAAYAAQQASNEKLLTDNDKFRGDDLARQAAYNAARAETDRQYAEQSKAIDQGRQQIGLAAASDFFGQLANLQHSSNNKIARIGKAAAIAQAIINTYQSATAAFSAMASIPYVGPALGAAAAAVAIATGLANVAQIRAQPDSYATGGPIRGPGTGTSDSVLMWGSNGEFMQSEAAVKKYGLDFMQSVNSLQYPGFADGGFVDSMAGAHRTVMPDFDAIGQNASAAPQVHNNVRVLTSFDANDLAQKILSTPAGEKLVVAHVIANGSAVKQGIG
jgi:hypothetical protein